MLPAGVGSALLRRGFGDFHPRSLQRRYFELALMRPGGVLFRGSDVSYEHRAPAKQKDNRDKKQLHVDNLNRQGHDVNRCGV
jgi:hypothetical protein